VTGHVVVDHHHDTAAGVYRLAVGVPIVEAVAVLGAGGEPVLGGDGAPLMEDRVVDYADAHEVVWDDGDARWWTGGRRRAAGDIAAEQRAEVAAAIGDLLAESDAHVAVLARARKPMPGAGGPLAEGSDAGRG
jgi:hypothetical protein